VNFCFLREEVRVNETPIENSIDIWAQIVAEEEDHEESCQDQDEGQHVVLDAWFKSHAEIVLGHLLAEVHQQHPLEIVDSIDNIRILLLATPVLLECSSNTIDRYQLDEVSRGVFAPVFLQVTLDAPVCLTLWQSLELVLRDVFYCFYFWNFPSGST